MCRFNPEKELKKIQNGNRNKVILGVFLLLIIIGISSSYALYQVRYSKRIIYTKVAPFSKHDIELAVNIKDENGVIESKNEFPSQEEAIQKELKYIGMDCDNKDEGYTIATWDSDKWGLNLFTKGPNKCTVLFEQVKDFSDIIVANNATIFEDGTEQNNIRYAGASDKVNNYIWFNCNDYSKTMDETNCEKWRIIGLFKNVTKADGETEDLVKIIRDEPLPNYYVWDNKPSGTGTSSSNYGSNNWTDSRLMMLLNPSYENSNLNDTGVTGSLYWNHGTGKCSGATSSTNVSSGTTTDCDFTETGLKDGTTKNMIEYVTWNIGGHNTNQITVSQFYEAERGSIGGTVGKAPTTWNGYIGLMYPSDYGYATGGGSNVTRSTCLSTNLSSWDTGNNKTDCAGNDWLYNSSKVQWVIAPSSASLSTTFNVSNAGFVPGNAASNAFAVRPSLYLTTSVKIKSTGSGSGEYGSSTDPYVLVPQ